VQLLMPWLPLVWRPGAWAARGPPDRVGVFAGFLPMKTFQQNPRLCLTVGPDALVVCTILFAARCHGHGGGHPGEVQATRLAPMSSRRVAVDSPGMAATVAVAARRKRIVHTTSAVRADSKAQTRIAEMFSSEEPSEHSTPVRGPGAAKLQAAQTSGSHGHQELHPTTPLIRS